MARSPWPDRIINAVLMLIGAAIFAAIVYVGWLPADVVWAIVSGEVK